MCLFFIFHFSSSYSQNYTAQEIDSILTNENVKLNTNAKYNEAILFNEEMIKESEKIGYSKGIAKGNYYLGSLFSTLGSYKESFRYLDLAKKMAREQSDDYLEASILLEYAKNYQELGLYKEAVKLSKKTENIGHSIKKQYDRETILLYSYSALMSNYYGQNKADSAYYYLLKSYKTEMSAYNLSALAYHHLNYTKNSDSTEYYLNATQKVLNHQSDLIFEKAILENLWGDFYLTEKKYKEALDHYLASIPFAVKSQATTEIANSYKGISSAYERLGKSNESKEFLVKYYNYKDSLANNKKHIIDASLQMVIEERDEAIKTSRRHMIIGISIIFVIVCGVVYVLVKRQIKQKQDFDEKLMNEHRRLKNTETETNELKQLVNPAFNEVVQLAKSNSPEFPIRFKQVYPEFCKRLLEINPDLQTSDLRFCALISLNFSTKDIAEYTFVSPRSVQSKKYRLRKKLKLDSEADIYLFMSNLMTGIMS